MHVLFSTSFTFQELQSELEFVQCLSRDLVRQCRVLPSEIPDDETQEMKDKLKRLQHDISVLENEISSITQANCLETTQEKIASVVVTLPAEVVERKPTSHEREETGDFDLGDSESGVSSMESFDGILRKENDHFSGESGRKENGALEQATEIEDLEEDGHPNGGISITPDEYERIRLDFSEESTNSTLPQVGFVNKGSSNEFDDVSRDSVGKSSDISVPMLMVTDQDGARAEVVFAENTPENGDDESIPDQAGEFFIDDFDVYYGKGSPKIGDEMEETSAGDRTVVAENENDKLVRESSMNEPDIGSKSSAVSEQEQSGSPDDQSSEIVSEIKVGDAQLSDEAITVNWTSQDDTVTVDALQRFDISADLESDDVPRHSTPSELSAPTETDENASSERSAQAITDVALRDTVESVNLGMKSSSNDTGIFPLSDMVENGANKRRKYEPQSDLSFLESEPTEQRNMSGEASLQASLASLASLETNEEMDKLDRLCTINEKEEPEMKPQDKIASIVAERRKTEEAERLRFAEDSIRDPDYELFTSRPLDLRDRSSPLKDLDESGNLLHEDMSLDEFLVEVEKLVEKLHTIEELISADQDLENNVKEELAKHVVSCRSCEVEMPIKETCCFSSGKVQFCVNGGVLLSLWM